MSSRGGETGVTGATNRDGGEVEPPYVSPPVGVADLLHTELARLSDAALADRVADWGRLASWVAAEQLRVVQEMNRRAERGPVTEAGQVADEVSCALGESAAVGRELVSLAELTARAPAIHRALGDGTLSLRKARGIVLETAHLPAEAAEVVHRGLFVDAKGRPVDVHARTVRQLRDSARRAVLACDPTAAARRAETARAERGVWLTPAPDTMAYLTALLPAADAVTVMTAVDALAAGAAPDDPRGVDARRADALVDTLRQVLDSGADLDGRALPTRQGRRPHLQITCTLDALVGATETPADLAGYGPVPVQVARRLAATAAWSVAVVEPTSGQVARSTPAYRPAAALVRAVVDRDRTCTFPGCAVPADKADLDHVVPFDPARPAAGQTRVDNLAALCRHHHRMKTHGRWRPHRDPLTGVTLWFSPAGLPYTRDPDPVPAESRWTRRRLPPDHHASAQVLAEARMLDPGSPGHALAAEPPPTRRTVAPPPGAGPAPEPPF